MRLLAEFLRSRGVIVVTLILAAQALGLNALVRRDDLAAHIPLWMIPEKLGPWDTAENQSLSVHEQSNLKPDDYVARIYSNRDSPNAAALLVLYFASQRTERAPHSPRNCLPGNGWVPERFQPLAIPLDRGATATVNRVTVRNGDHLNVVLYWYHSSSGAVANEYWAKVRLILDAMLLGRSDTALVRITVPVTGMDEHAAETTAVEFARLMYPYLERHIHP